MIKMEKAGDRIRTWSDRGVMIRQMDTGILYEEAIDVPGLHMYEETDVEISEEEIPDSKAISIILGYGGDMDVVRS